MSMDDQPCRVCRKYTDDPARVCEECRLNSDDQDLEELWEDEMEVEE